MDRVSGREEPLAPVPGAFQVCEDLSPDGTTLVYIERTPETPFDIWTVPVRGGGRPAPVLRSSSGKGGVRFSPDGRYLSFVSDESGRSEAYVMPYPGPGEKRRVSLDGALLPRWNRDGGELLYLSADRRLMSVAVRTSPALSLGAPRPLFGLSGKHSWSDFVVTPDGKRILAIEPESVGGEQPLTVVANWVPGAGR
jgi:dipeptidyl aminopeptidase/acylaminoacyl peptidase